MAIQTRAVKGGLSIAAAYLMIQGLQMTKFGRPEQDEETGEFTTVPAVQYTARAQLYESADDRRDNFGAASALFAFTFEHVNGADPVAEAYAHIKMHSLDGWAFYDLADV